MKIQLKILVFAATIVSLFTLLHFSGTVNVNSQIIEHLPSLDTLSDYKDTLSEYKDTLSEYKNTVVSSTTSKTTEEIKYLPYEPEIIDPVVTTPEISAAEKELHNAPTDSDYDMRDESSELIDTPLPRRNFVEFAKYPPHNINEPSKFAYATLLCTPKPHPKDPFFAATQSLVWRILWSDWHSKYPMIVFVCPSTPQYQRDILAGQGAIVKELELITGVIDASELFLARWRDQLTKLNMWRETEYKRILFLDSDAFPIKNIDDLFDEIPTQTCKHDLLSDDDKATMATNQADELCQYTFGGTVMSNNDGKDLNGGVFLFSPSLVWHAKLMRDLHKTDQYNFRTAEQGLLDSVLGFGKESAFPRYHFTQHYNADQEFYMLNRDKDNMKVLHCKMWSQFSLPDDDKIKAHWDLDWMSMTRFFDSRVFAEARETGRRKEPLEALAEILQAKADREAAAAGRTPSK